MNASLQAMFAGATVALTIPAHAQIGSGFIYQGTLRQAGEVVNGTADFQFRLFYQASSIIQLGPTINLNAVDVVGGRFSAALDFGPGLFNGNERHLEIAVRSPAGTGNFVILTPRQRVSSPTPYAHSIPGRDGHSLDGIGGSPVDAVFVNHTGDVGIGTSGPAGVLDIRSGNNSYVRVDSVNGDLHMNGGTDRVAGVYNDSTGIDARTDILVNDWPQMVINGGGGVGIGTLTPLRRFTVVDGGIFTARFESVGTLFAGPEFANATSGATSSLLVGPTGRLEFFQNVGWGSAPLAIEPNSWISLGDQPGPTAFRLELLDSATAHGRARANAWTTYSSARWKDNVRTLDDALDKVMQLRGVSFDWKPEHGGTRDIGFVAEEVGKVVPEIVAWEKDGTWAQGLAYDRVTAVAVEAVKQQQREIEGLRETSARLTELIDGLEGRLAALGDRTP